MKIERLLLIVITFFGLFPAGEAAEPKPKLVLVISIDQFRADYLTRYRSKFLPALDNRRNQGRGFNYLMTKGAYFPFAQYDLLQNMTGPGHATILTGAYPYQMGIPLNRWFDQKTGQPGYCVEDPDQPLVGSTPATGKGISPKTLISTTVGDELKNATPKSQVVSIALKDRAAVLMGGHRADLSLWLEPKSFQWVSSKYYFPNGQLPPWIGALNQKLKSQKDTPYEWKPNPKKVTIGSEESLAMPYGIDITLEAAEKAINAFKLGQDAATDILAISLSTHDYLGHELGPNHGMMEEMTVYEDRALSQFLTTVNAKIPGGLDNVLVVLTADHGIPPVPEQLAKDKVPAGRFDEHKLVADLDKYLTDRFGSSGDKKWVKGHIELNLYLNSELMKDKGVEPKVVEEEARKYLLEHSDITQYVITRTDVKERHLPGGLLESQILKSYYPSRSGDLILIQKPYFLPGTYGGTDHMTGYSYDRTVPIILMGKHLKAGTYATRAAVVDIAPTVSFLLGIIAPTMSEGRVLADALN